jgi:ribosomal protein L28
MGGHRILLRAHYNPTNWTRKYPNLQYATVDGKRMLICTACLRTLHKAPHTVAHRKAAVAAK